MKTRYLVTHSEGNVSPSKASKVLSMPLRRVKSHGILDAAKEPDEDDVIHFETLGISSVLLTPEQAEALEKHDEVISVEEDGPMYIQGFVDSLDETPPPAPTYQWNITMVNAPEAWTAGYTGKGVKLAILDTGIAQHDNLVISGGVCKIPGSTSYTDLNGHGTHCAGIAAAIGVDSVYGVAKKCDLYAVKVLGDDGKGDRTNIIAGMEWCIENGISIASMSLGGPNRPSGAYSGAIKRCADNGVTVICAAGNSYQTRFPWVNSPANSAKNGADATESSPLAVAAVDQNKDIANFSCRGTDGVPWNPVNVSAPGVKIYSTYLNNGYKKLSGTSMACPHVSGLAALIKEKNPSYTPVQIMEMIRNTSVSIGPAPVFGSGLINCQTATA